MVQHSAGAGCGSMVTSTKRFVCFSFFGFVQEDELGLPTVPQASIRT